MVLSAKLTISLSVVQPKVIADFVLIMSNSPISNLLEFGLIPITVPNGKFLADLVPLPPPSL